MMYITIYRAAALWPNASFDRSDTGNGFQRLKKRGNLTKNFNQIKFLRSKKFLHKATIDWRPVTRMKFDCDVMSNVF